MSTKVYCEKQMKVIDEHQYLLITSHSRLPRLHPSEAIIRCNVRKGLGIELRLKLFDCEQWITIWESILAYVIVRNLFARLFRGMVMHFILDRA